MVPGSEPDLREQENLTGEFMGLTDVCGITNSIEVREKSSSPVAFSKF